MGTDTYLMFRSNTRSLILLDWLYDIGTCLKSGYMFVCCCFGYGKEVDLCKHILFCAISVLSIVLELCFVLGTNFCCFKVFVKWSKLSISLVSFCRGICSMLLLNKIDWHTKTSGYRKQCLGELSKMRDGSVWRLVKDPDTAKFVLVSTFNGSKKNHI